ncbi:uncharacterized protein BXZ73DRAFT_74646 [Epithele typhae]|uniref:uncharacterized protein n=1 Tax=Epithele typhae TaxID=378194 RepID=UPI00200720D3|nr:uncharacterized protein BXZ73DRAFT_74646 [Epithele typhae]KAH9942380.1 hypothetical protein BXZ73DRAFT_74646 [Epithele typhae]
MPVLREQPPSPSPKSPTEPPAAPRPQSSRPSASSDLSSSSSSSSSVPSLTSEESATSSSDSEILAYPLGRLSLQDQGRSHPPLVQPKAPSKVHFPPTSSPPAPNRALDQTATRNERSVAMLEREHHPEWRSAGRDSPAPSPAFAASPLPYSPLASASASAAAARPTAPRRASSYSKRHASFDSPREIPLPYMPHREPSYPTPSSSTSHSQGPGIDSNSPTRLTCLASDSWPDSSRQAYGETAASSSSDSTPSTSSSPPTSMGGDPKASRASVADYMDMSDSGPSSTLFHSSRGVQHPRPQSPRLASSSSSSTALPLFTRPFSSPDASRAIISPRPMRPPGVPDRGSTASLPLPADTPLHTLPALAGGPIQEDVEMVSAAPTRPSSSRPSVGSHQASTSLVPSSSGWAARRSPSLVSEMEHEEFMSLVANRIVHRAYSASALSPHHPTSAERPYPPPAPPTVLTPPPPPLSQARGPAAPYEPFLAHAPPPQDSYVAVDTRPTEYRLVVRLPGFRRDAITVSSRKRRILHVVADSWEPNGGHFEQRISFGYDAILTQVRAEFDGEHLQVIVPRRAVPMT